MSHHITEASGPACQHCGQPKHTYYRYDLYGKKRPYYACNWQACKDRRREKMAEARAAKIAGPLPEPIVIPTEPTCHCGMRKTLTRQSGTRASIWVCHECRDKRRQAADRDRKQDSQTGTDPCWEERRDYRRVMARIYRRDA